jgi:hypothetical protein
MHFLNILVFPLDIFIQGYILKIAMGMFTSWLYNDQVILKIANRCPRNL